MHFLMHPYKNDATPEIFDHSSIIEPTVKFKTSRSSLTQRKLNSQNEVGLRVCCLLRCCVCYSSSPALRSNWKCRRIRWIRWEFFTWTKSRQIVKYLLLQLQTLLHRHNHSTLASALAVDLDTAVSEVSRARLQMLQLLRSHLMLVVDMVDLEDQLLTLVLNRSRSIRADSVEFHITADMFLNSMVDIIHNSMEAILIRVECRIRHNSCMFMCMVKLK